MLSQNIANADTPDYRPKRPRAAAFTRLVDGIFGRPGRLAVAQTDRTHPDGAPVARPGHAVCRPPMTAR